MTAPRVASSGALWYEPVADAGAGALSAAVIIADPDSPGDYLLASEGTPAAVFVADGSGAYVLTPVGSADPTAARGPILRTAAGDYLSF